MTPKNQYTRHPVVPCTSASRCAPPLSTTRVGWLQQRSRLPNPVSLAISSREEDIKGKINNVKTNTTGRKEKEEERPATVTLSLVDTICHPARLNDRDVGRKNISYNTKAVALAFSRTFPSIRNEIQDVYNDERRRRRLPRQQQQQPIDFFLMNLC